MDSANKLNTFTVSNRYRAGVHGLHAWNVKYYGWMDEFEPSEAIEYFLGPELEKVSELLGRPVTTSFEGRSGGWFVINEELTADEITVIDTYINKCMRELPQFLHELRAEIELAKTHARKQDDELRADVLSRDYVKALLAEFGGGDSHVELTINGVKII